MITFTLHLADVLRGMLAAQRSGNVSAMHHNIFKFFLRDVHKRRMPLLMQLLHHL